MALAVLMWKRPHSTLDVWLMVVMSVWIFDIALSAVLNRGRFDIGWYSGRIYGLLAASFVLVMLLIENGRLYRRLAGAHDRERRRTRDLSQALDALHEKDEELRTVVDNVFDGIITIDSHGVILSANRAVESIFGHRRDDLVGRNVSVLMPAPIDEAHGGHLDAYRRTGTAGIIGTIREVEGVHSNGERIPLDLAVSAFNGRDGSCFVGTLRDIRERKRTIAELISARADAEQATRAKADFLAAMSHEIRTPMNGVIGMIEVLHQSSLKGYQVEMIDLIRESAFSLLTIIDDILDFSKIEAGRLDIEEAPLSIADQIDRVGGVLDHLAMHKGVTFTFFCDPRVPALVMGDAQRLGQILINLTNNAIKFSSGLDRPGRVSLRARPVSEDGDHVTIDFTITDNGIGMDGKTVEGLFIPFHQAGASTARRFGGTGLGLAISQNLAALMHGRISAVSIPGSGSTFTLRLPFAIAPEDGTAPRPEPRPQEVAGLYCLVIGGPSSLAADIALQLDHDGAMVATAPDLAFASTTCASPPPSGTTPPVRVWIIDTEGEDPPPSEAVAAIAGAGTGQVVIGRGGNRQPRRQDGSRVTIDGNALTRRMLRRSVAIAAGRAAPGEEEERPGRQDSAFVQPPREEAIRRGSLVLVAEDNETNRKVISHQLALLGYAADVVADGAAALERWKTGDYALLLTDLQMPGMDGYELTAAVRAHEQPGRAGARQFPIVALTANALKSEEDRCRMAGMDGYLSKPAKLADLQATLEHWLPPHGPGAGSGAPAPVDLSILTELVGDDPAVIRELLTDFLHTTAETAELIRTAAGTGQTGQAGTAAHKLKSSARSIGAQCLGDLCGRIERAAGAGSGDTLVALMAPFQAELTTVTSHLDRHLADLTGLASAGSPQASGEPSP
ncbi:MAG: response regulator [Telmatospirillum sp.]|nr:response regulator [Telmatospirillum sp.]